MDHRHPFEGLPGVAPWILSLLLVCCPETAVWSAVPSGDADTPADEPPRKTIHLEWLPQSAQVDGRLLLGNLHIVPNPRLGVAFPAPDPAVAEAVLACGMGIVRMEVSWAEREPVRGQFAWEGLDNKIQHLQESGANAFLTFATDSGWGTLPSEFTSPNRVPSDMAAWAGFVSACVERYDHDGVGDAPGMLRPVDHYQFINEWPSQNHRTGGWAGDIDQLIATLDVSHDAVKAAWPGATVILGGIPAGALDAMVLSSGMASYVARIAYTPDDIVYLDSLRAQSPTILESVAVRERVLAEARYDVADMHLYGPVEFNQHRIERVRLAAPGAGLVSAECGGPSLAYVDSVTPEGHFLAALDMNLDALARGVRFILWFGMVEREFVEGEGTTYGTSQVPLFDQEFQPKGGYWAYCLLGSILADLKGVAKLEEGTYLIESHDRPDITVAWAPGGSGALALSPLEHPDLLVRVVDAARGAFVFERVPDDGVVALTSLPVIISDKLPAGDFGPGDPPVNEPAVQDPPGEQEK
ncbi:MAG: beta-galactosidase [Candidatus Krumholzibacteriia bacterium]